MLRRTPESFLRCRKAVEAYFGDFALFVAPTAVGNPIAGLNDVLAGASALSIGDVRKATGQACGIATSVCRPLSSNMVSSPTQMDVAKYAALAKAFDSIATQGGALQ